jgi:ABC-type dipeptide/oligopeptide/nickel transport system ATPase component
VVSAEEEALKPPWPWERNLALDSGAVSQGCPFAPRCPFAEVACWQEVPALARVRDGHQSGCHMITGRIENKLLGSTR